MKPQNLKGVNPYTVTEEDGTSETSYILNLESCPVFLTEALGDEIIFTESADDWIDLAELSQWILKNRPEYLFGEPEPGRITGKSSPMPSPNAASWEKP